MTKESLNHCPKCGGPADNGHDRCLPPSPYFCTKCMAGGDLVERLTALMGKYPNGHDIRDIGTVSTVWALAIQAAIAAINVGDGGMVDAVGRTRTLSGSSPDSPGQTCEIMDNSAAITLIESWLVEPGTYDQEAWDKLKPLLERPTKPVVVSLEKCAGEISGLVNINGDIRRATLYTDMAKAVLDAAGVKYVG